MKAEWKHWVAERHGYVTETVTVHAFLPMGQRMVVTDSFHGFKDPVNPTVVAVVERTDGALAWCPVSELKVLRASDGGR